MFLVECGLAELGTCLPEMFFQFILSILNGAIEPLLELVKILLSDPVNTMAFYPLWAVVIYILSLFYGLFFLFSGFNFLISGYDAVKRERAKTGFANIVLMVLFVQSSFLIYNLITELAGLLSTGVIGLINPDFFLANADNVNGLGLQIILLVPYLITLVITIALLGLRYLLVMVGVAFFPFGIFFYFISPLQPYGKMIMNTLMVVIFTPFFASLIIFSASALTQLPIFENWGIILSMITFVTVNLFFLGFIIFAILKSVNVATNSSIGQALKQVGGYLY